MTREEAYELMQKQNWYKLFIKEVCANYRQNSFNESFRRRTYPREWIDKTMWWDETRQGRLYWSEIHTKWKILTRQLMGNIIQFKAQAYTVKAVLSEQGIVQRLYLALNQLNLKLWL